MTAILLLGIGSPDPSDQCGWEAVRYVKGNIGRLASPVAVELLDRPGTRLVEFFSRAPTVVLVDAMQAGLPPGTVKAIEPGELAATDTLSSHGFGVAESIALAEALNQLPHRLTVIGIQCGGSVEEAGEELLTLIGRIAAS